MTLSEELIKLAELHERGVLTSEEFARAKTRLLHSEAMAAPVGFVAAVNAFRRSRSDCWIAGVCGGLAQATGMASWAWRLLLAALCLFGGFGLLLYLLLWVFVPRE
jgi:phage shock protein C